MSQDGDRPEYGVPAGSNMPAKKRRVQRACDAYRQKRKACISRFLFLLESDPTHSLKWRFTYVA
ncbi:hypothetical protein K438DRAFT_663214 [Mycena galopus ATCC 62051]|nr:hypothetical protein K438DRAFT_663214 [Mycena galopus ATCC 62051]